MAEFLPKRDGAVRGVYDLQMPIAEVAPAKNFEFFETCARAHEIASLFLFFYIITSIVYLFVCCFVLFCKGLSFIFLC